MGRKLGQRGRNQVEDGLRDRILWRVFGGIYEMVFLISRDGRLTVEMEKGTAEDGGICGGNG